MEQTATKVDRQGRIVIPAEYRRALGLREGDPVTVQLDDGELRILTRAQAIRRAQEILAPYLAGKPSPVDELIAERRAEAARE